MSSLSILRDDDGKPITIPIDDKTIPRSYTNADKSEMLHIVSAWALQQGITLSQIAVDSKSNEITVIPELLKMLDLHGTIVSIDTMGCQRQIATKSPRAVVIMYCRSTTIVPRCKRYSPILSTPKTKT